MSCRSDRKNKSVSSKKQEISAEEIIKTLDEFGSDLPYEFQTRGSRHRSGENMFDPLNAKLGQPGEITDNQDVSSVEVPTLSKDILESEWIEMFSSKDYREKLRSLALRGKLRDYHRFHGVCWRIFLECLPDDTDKWMEQNSKLRANYETLKSKFLTDPYSSVVGQENTDLFNPLSQHTNSPWGQYFEDKKLNNVILQDLDRLFPGMYYFQSEKIRNILLHILFCYARKNPSVGYKQGMHEILAPLVFVLEYDSEAFSLVKNSDNELMKVLIDPEYLEYDAFALFDHLMDIIEPWYDQNRLQDAPNKTDLPAGVPFMSQLMTSPPTAIVRKINKIQETMLKKYDRVLYNHLRDFEIEPQLYGLRWVRLLFGREFTTMEDILILWDGLFADSISLDLVDYIFISLICNKRRKLLSSDHSGCLTALMKTPFSKRGAKVVLLDARHMRDTKLNTSEKATEHQLKQESRSSVTIEFPESRPAKMAGSLQAVLKANRHTPSKKVSETRSQNTLRVKKPDVQKDQPHEEHRRTVELKSNNKDAPSFHMFPNDPDGDDLFINSRTSNATFLSKLSSKVRNPSKIDVATLQQDHERLQVQVSQFKAEVDKLHSISIYCGKKMDSYISLLQDQITSDQQNMDIVYLSIAGLKQVRDLLKGTLSFQPSTVEQDSEFTHIDSVISSINPAFKTSVDSPKKELPESLPVPLLADFGHFEGQIDEYILVESNVNNDKDVSLNSADQEDSKSSTQDP